MGLFSHRNGFFEVPQGYGTILSVKKPFSSRSVELKEKLNADSITQKSDDYACHT
jgi:hypothetical protein